MIQVKEGVYWVGAVDWNLRNFHGHVTHHGTTYNAYLVVDDKIALVDTTKASFLPELRKRIEEIVDLSEINYIVSNHIEPDHAGAVGELTKLANNAELIATETGKRGLQKYFGEDLHCTTIKEKPAVNLGRRTLQFIATPMLHWPDSMVTYIPEDKLLLSNDAFGQHMASSGRFDDEVDNALLWQELAKYYANILMPLWRVVLRALDSLSGLDIDMIAPSHGAIWRKQPWEVMKAYRSWAEGVTSEKVVIAYDTMWGSTEQIAKALVDSIASEGVRVQLHRLSETHISDVVTDILDARAILVGSPTLNLTLFPTVASFLAYLKGLKPKNKIGAVFGSYGWSGGAKKAAEEELAAAGVELIESDLDIVYKPTKEELDRATEFGKKIARRVKGI